MIPEIVEEQLSSFGFGCEVELFAPQVPSDYGECGNIQFSIHEVQ